MPVFSSEVLLPTLELISEAVGIFDGADRLKVFNQNYKKLRSSLGGDVDRGVHWVRLVTASVRSGAIPEAVGHETEWLGWRLRSRGAYSVLRDLPDGTRYRINERRLPNGGIVVIWTKVSKSACSVCQATDRLPNASDWRDHAAPAGAAGHGARLAALIDANLPARQTAWTPDHQILYQYWTAAGYSTRAARVLARAGCRSSQDIRTLGRIYFLGAESCGQHTLLEIEQRVGGW